MLVQVFKLEEPTDLLASFPLGTHTLGRGSTLQCNDKRVSRNHATLEVTPQSTKLLSTHINPCFLKAGKSKTITILANGSSTELSDGDSFAFLPDVFWFKVKIVKDNDGNDVSDVAETSKRQLDDGEQVPEKRQKTEVETKDIQALTGATDEIDKREIGESSGITDEIIEDDENVNGPQEDVNGPQADVNVPQEDVNVPQEDVNGPQEDVNGPQEDVNGPQEDVNGPEEDINGPQEDVNAPPEEEKTSSPEVKLEPDSQSSNDVTNPGPSVPRPRREKCWYGIECYRKNDVHRREYTHPGDSDFESDPDDNRPACSYGAACYRKNKDHRRDYKHPPKQHTNTIKKKRARKKVDRLNVANSQDLRDLSDSDEEDPFIADDDSDEYVQDSDEEDTDWDSQNVDEDSENVKKLLREANRFIKK